jgi:hypothetical protein
VVESPFGRQTPLDLQSARQRGLVAGKLMQGIELLRDLLVVAGAAGAVEDLQSDQRGGGDAVLVEMASATHSTASTR